MVNDNSFWTGDDDGMAQKYTDPDGPCSTFSYILNLNLTVNQTCPPGFNISESAMACICEPRLERYTDNCNITNGVGQITRNLDKQFWVGYGPCTFAPFRRRCQSKTNCH